MQDREDIRNKIDLARRNGTLLDLLRHEVSVTIGGDRVLKRLERVLLQPELLKELTFEQIIQYMDRIMKRQKDGREFIIDFYRVTSKSPDIQATLKQHTIMDESSAEVIDGEVVSIETEKEVRNKLLLKLDALLKAQEQEQEKEGV